MGGIVFIIFLMVAVFFIRKATFSLDRVAVSITGLNQAESGKLLTYEIVCSNNNQATLKGAVLKIGYPSDFKPEENADFTEEGPVSGKFSLGDIPAHSTKKIIFNGRAYSPRGALIYVKADLTYSPSGFSSQYVTSNQLGVNVTTSPISLEIMAPQNVASGDEVNYLINYKNTGERDFEGLRIKMDYPDGFTFSTSDPKSFEGNNIWYIGTLTPENWKARAHK